MLTCDNGMFSFLWEYLSITNPGSWRESSFKTHHTYRGFPCAVYKQTELHRVPLIFWFSLRQIRQCERKRKDKKRRKRGEFERYLWVWPGTFGWRAGLMLGSPQGCKVAVLLSLLFWRGKVSWGYRVWSAGLRMRHSRGCSQCPLSLYSFSSTLCD